MSKNITRKKLKSLIRAFFFYSYRTGHWGVWRKKQGVCAFSFFQVIEFSFAFTCANEDYLIEAATDVKMELPVLIQSPESHIKKSSTIFQMDKTFCDLMSAAVEQ